MASASDNDRSVQNACATLLDALKIDSVGLVLDKSLQDALMAEMTSWNLGLENDPKHVIMMQFAAAVPALVFPNHTPKLKQLISTLIWLAYTFEHDTAGTLSAISEMQHRLLTGKHQLHPLIDQFIKALSELYVYYDSLAADAITASFLAFIFTCNIEPRPDYLATPYHPAGLNWANYIRTRNGLGEPLAWLTFSKEENPNTLTYVQAVPDIAHFIDYLNDVLRFQMEENMGEYQNYTRARADCTNKPNIDVLYEVGEESVQAKNRVDSILRGQGKAEQAWNDLKVGFVGLHKWSEAPYMLSSMGLGQDIPATPTGK